MPRPPLQNVTLNPPSEKGFVYSPTPSTSGSKGSGETTPSAIHVKKTRVQRPPLGGPIIAIPELEKEQTPSILEKDKKDQIPPVSKRSSSFTRVKSWGEDIGDVAAGIGLGRWSSVKNRTRDKVKDKSEKPKSAAQRGIFGRVLGSWAKDIDGESDAVSESDGDSVYSSSTSEIDTTDSESDADRSISYARARRFARNNSVATTLQAVQSPIRTIQPSYRTEPTTPDKEFAAWRVSTPTTPRAATRQATSSSASIYKAPPPPIDIKRGRPPSLRLGLDICCTVSGADVRGGQEAWCSVTFRGEIDDGDWDVQHCDGGIDVAVVLDIS